MAMWLPLKACILLISATSFGIHASKKAGAEDCAIGIALHNSIKHDMDVSNLPQKPLFHINTSNMWWLFLTRNVSTSMKCSEQLFQRVDILSPLKWQTMKQHLVKKTIGALACHFSWSLVPYIFFTRSSSSAFLNPPICLQVFGWSSCKNCFLLHLQMCLVLKKFLFLTHTGL